MKTWFKLAAAIMFAGILFNSELDRTAAAVLYILFIVLIQLHSTFEMLRDRRPNAAWRSRYNRRRLF